MKVRTRFAPSPTGFLHIGALRTALYSYALAKSKDGDFVLRIEDTDRSRLVEGSMEDIVEMLEAYRIPQDEGPHVQSDRIDIYKQHAQELVEKDAAYYCFLTNEEADEIKSSYRKQQKPFRSPHRNLSEGEVKKMLASNKPYVIRQKIPDSRTIKFDDGVQGQMNFNTEDIDDGVLLKTDGFPTYHLAVVVDDHLMEITDVLRAFEWIPSTPKHLLLYEAFGWELPNFYHLSTILDPNGGKLSKRKGATSAKEFLMQGYLPSAVLNFLMLLGWSSSQEREYGEAEQELFSLEEFISLFDPKDLNKNNPVFNEEKLLWFNQQYIQNTPTEQLADELISWMSTYAKDKQLLDELREDKDLPKKLELVNTRAKTLEELTQMLVFFYKKPTDIKWDIKQLKKIDPSKFQPLMDGLSGVIASLPDIESEWDHSDWEHKIRSLADKHEVKHGQVFMMLRLAVTGSSVSPPLFESLQILGKNEVLARL